MHCCLGIYEEEKPFARTVLKNELTELKTYIKGKNNRILEK
jgi:hypothetical protein